MKTVCSFILFIAITLSSASAQNESVLGWWQGEWSDPGGHLFSFVLHLKETEAGELEGSFVWRLQKSPREYEQPKLGLEATEFVVGNYNPNTRTLYLRGTGKEDPNLIIDPDVYHLILSKDEHRIEGKTNDHGTNQGKIWGIRPPRV